MLFVFVRLNNNVRLRPWNDRMVVGSPGCSLTNSFSCACRREHGLIGDDALRLVHFCA